MAGKKQNSLSREQAAELYRDLQKNLAALKLKRAAGRATKGSSANDNKSVAAEIAASIREAMKRDDAAGSTPARTPPSHNRIEVAGEEPSVNNSAQTIFRSLAQVRGQEGGTPRGAHTAVALVVFFAVVKIVLSGLESSGIATTTPVEASMRGSSVASISDEGAPASRERATSVLGGGELSREEMRILTSLDARRAELDDRSRKLDERQGDLDGRERALAEKLTELRELTERLKVERDRDERKRSTQLDQLANVYGSMNPPEAAHLLEQLDTAIALSLIERMPEKRIGQILSLMSPEKALMMTKMLSSRAR